jgi:hypothetical protein
MMRDYLHPIERNRSLSALLRRAVKDTYKRQNKSSRNYARKKNPDPPAGPPEIITATRTQIRCRGALRTSHDGRFKTSHFERRKFDVPVSPRRCRGKELEWRINSRWQLCNRYNSYMP